jgi:hypothetical protein
MTDGQFNSIRTSIELATTDFVAETSENYMTRISIGDLHDMVEEIESLRSQLAIINSHDLEGRNYTNAEYVALRQKLQQVEQERDTHINKLQIVDANLKDVADKFYRAEQERDEQKQLKRIADECMSKAIFKAADLLEANTAMREAIIALKRDYLDEDFLNGPDGESDATVGYRLAYKRICEVLSRYPKEGDTTCETDTVKK